MLVPVGLVLAMLATAPVPEVSPTTGPSFGRLLLVYSAGAVADGVTTEWFKARGGDEVLNPWHGGSGRSWAIQAGGVLLLATADRFALQRGSPRLARLARWAATLYKVVLSLNNSYVAVTGRGGLFR